MGLLSAVGSVPRKEGWSWAPARKEGGSWYSSQSPQSMLLTVLLCSRSSPTWLERSRYSLEALVSLVP